MLNEEDLYMIVFKNLIFVDEYLHMLIQNFNVEWGRFIYDCVWKFIYACVKKFNIWWERFIYACVKNFNIGWGRFNICWWRFIYDCVWKFIYACVKKYLCMFD